MLVEVCEDAVVDDEIEVMVGIWERGSVRRHLVLSEGHVLPQPLDHLGVDIGSVHLDPIADGSEVAHEPSTSTPKVEQTVEVLKRAPL